MFYLAPQYRFSCPGSAAAVAPAARVGPPLAQGGGARLEVRRGALSSSWKSLGRCPLANVFLPDIPRTVKIGSFVKMILPHPTLTRQKSKILRNISVTKIRTSQKQTAWNSEKSPRQPRFGLPWRSWWMCPVKKITCGCPQLAHF